MTPRRDLLVEIGTEELPPKALKRLRDAFAAGVVSPRIVLTMLSTAASKEELMFFFRLATLSSWSLTFFW